MAIRKAVANVPQCLFVKKKKKIFYFMVCPFSPSRLLSMQSIVCMYIWSMRLCKSMRDDIYDDCVLIGRVYVWCSWGGGNNKKRLCARHTSGFPLFIGLKSSILAKQNESSTKDQKCVLIENAPTICITNVPWSLCETLSEELMHTYDCTRKRIVP